MGLCICAVCLCGGTALSAIASYCLIEAIEQEKSCQK